MKEPIEPSEIRKGDLIRSEARDGVVLGENLVASEWIADESDADGDFLSVRLYLLDRPKPAVELPSEPTLGWITADKREGRRLGRWKRDRDGDAAEIDNAGDTVNTWYGVTAFTPATAVPTAALDELREWHSTAPEPTWGRIATFLAAVDEAQS